MNWGREMQVTGREARTLILLILLLLVACKVPNLPGPDEAMSPKALLDEWYSARGEYNVVSMYKLTHPARQRALEETIESPSETVKDFLDFQRMDYIEMHYAITYEDSDVMRIEVRGRANTVYNRIVDINETVELRRFEGDWYVWSVEGWF